MGPHRKDAFVLTISPQPSGGTVAQSFYTDRSQTFVAMTKKYQKLVANIAFIIIWLDLFPQTHIL